MIKFARARTSRAISDAAAASDAPPWLYRSEAFAEDLIGLVSALPQWQQSAAARRMPGGLDGMLRDGAGFRKEDRDRGGGGAGAGSGLFDWARRPHWQGA